MKRPPAQDPVTQPRHLEKELLSSRELHHDIARLFRV